MQLRNPNFKVVNQERAANFILEQLRNEAAKVPPFLYSPGVNETAHSSQIGIERQQVQEELMQFKAAGDEIIKEL